MVGSIYIVVSAWRTLCVYVCEGVMPHGCAGNICLMIIEATAGIVRLNKIWNSRSIGFCTRVRLYKSLVVPVMLHSFETGDFANRTTVKDSGVRDEVL